MSTPEMENATTGSVGFDPARWLWLLDRASPQLMTQLGLTWSIAAFGMATGKTPFAMDYALRCTEYQFCVSGFPVCRFCSALSESK